MSDAALTHGETHAAEDETAAPVPFGTGLRDRLAADGHPRPNGGESAAETSAPEPQRPEIGDVVSPELALVDPELALRARELLASYPEPQPSASPPAALQATGVPVALPERRPDPPAPARTRRRARPRRSGVAVLALLAPLAVLGWSVATRTETVATGGRAGTASGAGVVARAPSSTALPGAPTDTTVAPGRTRARATSPAPTAASSVPAVKAARRAGQSAQAAGARARAFGWVPVPKASVYRVEFFRGTRKVYETTTASARLALPARWNFGGRRYSFAPGRYRWRVRPGFRTASTIRFGPPVVLASLVIPAERS